MLRIRFSQEHLVSNQSVHYVDLAEVESQRRRKGSDYLEFLRVPAMSAGLYVLGAGSTDLQTPHRQDELYYIVQGKARMRAGSEERPVAQGSLIFVAANVEHRFYDVEEELTVLVFFAPAETG
jgi:mannose-6-phosphate isomerase-like protein (cupin superfamily)